MPFRLNMRPSGRGQTLPSDCVTIPSKTSTLHSALALTVVCLTLCTACSTVRPAAQMPPLAANLAALCQPLPRPPKPTIDPERITWELDIISRYENCALRHRLTVEAWAARGKK